MNGLPGDAQTKALEFVNSTSTYLLLATLALLAWVASGVEFSNDLLRIPALACLALSAGLRAFHAVRSCRSSRRRGGPGSQISTSRGDFCCSARYG